MKVAKNIALALMLGASVALTAGCSVARNQETLEEYVDGAAVTAEVKAKLANDPQTSAANINVKTIDGGVVQLSGFAKSETERNQAGMVARSVKGVTKVINDLVVKP